MGIWIILGFDFFPIHFYIPYIPATLRDGSAVMDLVPFTRPWLARLVFIKYMVIVVLRHQYIAQSFIWSGLKPGAMEGIIIVLYLILSISLLVDSGRATLGVRIYGSGII